MPAIGDALIRILDVTDELRAHIKTVFEPNKGIYRLNDFGEYVSADDWERVWAQHPAWWEKAWMLVDNGRYDVFDVAEMTVEEIEHAYADPAFVPEYAFYTEAGEDGLP